MAISHVINQSEGNELRSSMSAIDFDGAFVTGIGSTLGITAATTLDGVEVDASAALLYTSAAIQTNQDFVQAACELISAALDGAHCWSSMNTPDKFVMHIEATTSVGDATVTSLPVLTVV